jgi:hypothetical protein
MKKHKKLLLAAAVLLTLVTAVAAYAGDYYRADSQAIAAMAGNDTVTVTRSGNLTVFAPEEPEVGFIFYPGGKVEHSAYAPLLLELAEENILCVLVKMPLNLAVLDMGAAEEIPEQFPEIETWYIGGHSLGGSMAASFLADNTKTYEGLILLASYSTADLSETDLTVLSFWGCRDGVMNMEKHAQYMSNLPEDTFGFVIPGGNHAQFGNYGHQEGDGEAEISAEEQREYTVREILRLMPR